MNVHRKHHASSALFGLAISALVATPAMLTSTVTSVAQTVAAPPIVGVHIGTNREAFTPPIDAFVRGMTELGYVEGQNIRYEYRFGDGNPDRAEPNAQELIALAPAVIITGGNSSLRILAAATSTIPIVNAHARKGSFRRVVQNLERPEGNITGLVQPNVGPPELLQFAQELIPGAARIGYLINAANPNLDANKQAVVKAADPLGVTVAFGEPQSADDVVAAYQTVAAQDVDAVVVSSGGLFIARLAELAEAARAARMPTVYQPVGAVPAGGLIGLELDAVAHWRAAASLVDRLLKGETPADLPIVEGAPLRMSVNLAAAKDIGLTIPDSIMARATEVVR